MDIVLLKAVERLGDEGQVVQVKPGYARNYLIPGGLAAPATASEVRAVAEAKRQREAKVQRVLSLAEALKRKIEAKSLTLKLALGADDKPFGSISAHDVVDALKADGFAIDRHALQLAEPIKKLGIFELPIRLHPQVAATLKVWVVKE
jgi:large subunit ribosomal protein L9